MLNKSLKESIQGRRSYYDISNEAVISDEKIKEIIEFAVKYTPSAFNSQSARVALLLGDSHKKLWDITTESLKTIVGEDNFQSTQEKMDAFSAGYGSVLFFEEQSVVEGLQKQFELYADNFPVWSNHSSGMLQYVVWTSLESEGFGASLQHYNPIIDEKVKAEFNIASSWKLIAQMPFGKPKSEPGEKEFVSLEERIKVFK